MAMAFQLRTDCNLSRVSDGNLDLAGNSIVKCHAIISASEIETKEATVMQDIFKLSKGKLLTTCNSLSEKL